MTLIAIAVFIAVYLGLTVPGYLWLMRRHDRKIAAMYAQQTKRMQAIWSDKE